jgi:hypothetical protein
MNWSIVVIGGVILLPGKMKYLSFCIMSSNIVRDLLDLACSA